jgi:glucose/arabinose dehydrogenase
MRGAFVVIAVLALAGSACDESDDDDPTMSTRSAETSGATTSSNPAGDLDAVRIVLSPVADVESPTAMAVRDGDTSLYVAEQAGLVRAVRDGALDPEPVLDLTNRVQSGGEQGLLGLAFSPDGSRLYVHYSDRTNGGDNQIDEYQVEESVADPSSRRPILTVETLQANHNGGQLAFGPDGLLYIGLGDGGAAADRGEGHASGGNGQSLETLLGKILRIDPTASAGEPYAIPADNPFADGGGRPEIWAYGLRNPWRFAFDRETDDLWIGDVGQNAWEEIDFMPAGEGAGANYGWARLEGTHPFEGEPPADAVAPIFEYPNPNQGCSVTGGFVYRGARIPDLEGAYVFADYCEGELRALTQRGGQVTAERLLGVRAENVAAFGEDGDGELYVLSQGDGLLRVDPA